MFIIVLCSAILSSFYFSRKIPPCWILPNLDYLNSSSCQQVRLRDTNGVIRTEERCYPLLINFADGCCTNSQRGNCFSGFDHGVQQCLPLNKQMFDEDAQFVERNRNILKKRRGAGYWLWKSYAIYRELYLAREGDVIVYSDSASELVQDISHLIQLTEQQDVVIFSLIGWKVRIYTIFKH